MSSGIPSSPLTPQETAWIQNASQALSRPYTSSADLKRLRQEADQQHLSPEAIHALVKEVEGSRAARLLGVLPEDSYEALDAEDIQTILTYLKETNLSDIIENEEQRIRFAKVCAEKAPTACSWRFKQFGITDESTRIAIAKDLLTKKPKSNLSHFKNFEITDEREKLLIVRMLIETNPSSLIRNFDSFEITDESKRIEIAKILVEKEPENFAEHFSLFDIRDEDERFALFTTIAEKDPQACCHNLGEFGISEESKRIELAKIVAKTGFQYFAALFEFFDITDKNETLAIVKIIAEMSPQSCAENFKLFGITDEKERLALAKTIAEKSPQACAMHLKNFSITDEIEKLAIIKKIMEVAPKSVARYFSRFGISNEQEKLAIVKHIAESVPGECASYFKEFNIQDENERLLIAKIIAKKGPRFCASYFTNFGISNESERLALVETIIQVAPLTSAENFRKFGIADENKRIELAKIIAERGPEGCAEYFHSFEIGDEKSRVAIAKIIASKAPHALAEHFANFGITDKTDENEKVAIAKIIAEKNPNVCLSLLNKLNISTERMLEIFVETDLFKANPNRFFSLNLTLEQKQQLLDRYLAFLKDNPDKVDLDVILRIPFQLLSIQKLAEVQNTFPTDHPLPSMLRERVRLQSQLERVAFNPASMIVEVIPLPPIAELNMSVEQLGKRFLQYFDLINTTNPNHPFYMDPTTIRNADTIVSKEAARESLEKLFKNIEDRKQATAVPSAPEAKEKFYKNLEGWLGQISKKLDDILIEEGGQVRLKDEEGFTPEEQRLKFTEIVTQIAIAGSACGTRWKQVAQRYFKDLYKIEDSSPQKTLEREIAEFRLHIAEKMFPDDIHGFGMFVKMLGERLQIPGWDTADETMQGWHEFNLEQDLRAFEHQFHPEGITQYLTGRCQGDSAFRSFMEEQTKKVINSLAPEEIQNRIASLFEGRAPEREQLLEDFQHVLSHEEIPISLEDEKKFSEGVLIDALPEILAMASLDKPQEELFEGLQVTLENKFTTLVRTNRILIPQFVASLQDTPFFSEVLKHQNDSGKLDNYKKLAQLLKQERFLISKTVRFLQSCGAAVTKADVTSTFQNLRASKTTDRNAIEGKFNAMVLSAATRDYEPELLEQMKKNPFLMQRVIATILENYGMFIPA